MFKIRSRFCEAMTCRTVHVVYSLGVTLSFGTLQCGCSLKLKTSMSSFIFCMLQHNVWLIGGWISFIQLFSIKKMDTVQ